MLSRIIAARALAFALIVLLALGLRLWHVDLTTFGYDEAVLLQFAEDFVRQGVVPLSGPISSTGLSTPAHFIYLLTPVVALTRDPAASAAAIAVFGAAAVALTMVLGWRALGARGGLLAGALLAVNPLAVAYSRRIWQPDVLPFLTILLLLALDLGVLGRRAWWAAATLPLMMLAVLVHSSIAPLALLLLAPVVRLLRDRRWGPLVCGALAAALIAVPFVVYEFQTDWQDYPNLRYYASLQSFVDLDALRWLLAATTGWQLPNDGVIPAPQRVLPPGLIDLTAGIALALLAAGSLVAAVASIAIAGPTRIRLLTLLACVGLSVGFSIRHWQTIYLHYFFGVLPIAALLMGVPAAGLRLGPPGLVRLVRGAGLVAAAVVIALQSVMTVGGMAYQATAQGSDPCFMTSLGVMRSAAAETAAFGRAADSRRAVVELDTSAAKPMAYLLRPDFPDVILPRTRLLSQTPTLVGNVGLGIPPGSPAPDPLPPVLMAATTRLDAAFTTGVTVQDARYTAQSAADQHLLLAVTWSVDAAATGAEPLVWQVSLTDPSGKPVGADAGESWRPIDLRGQRSVSSFWFDARRDVAPASLPPGRYRLNLRLLDTSVTPAAVVPAAATTDTPPQSLALPVEIAAFQPCDLVSAIP